jgi:hypothetical protein
MHWGHAAIRLDGCVHVGRPFNGDDLIFLFCILTALFLCINLEDILVDILVVETHFFIGNFFISTHAHLSYGI